jgi:zinc/manganese transport system substrate-binding protein
VGVVVATMFVLVKVGAVVRQELGDVGFAVIVAVVVDDDREAVVTDQAAAERLGEQRGDEHRLWGAVGQEAPGEQHHPIGTTSFGEVVRREDHAAAPARVPLDDLEDSELARQVETRDRLVEQEQLGFGRDRLGDEDALLLTARQLTERPTAELRDLEQLGGGVDRPTILGPEPPQQASTLVPADAQHLVDRERHPTVVLTLLRDHGDAPAHLDGAVLGFDQTGEEREQRRLAAAVRSDEGDGLTVRDLEVDRRERDDGSVVHADVVSRGQRVGCDEGDGYCGCHGNDSHSSILRMILTHLRRVRRRDAAMVFALGLTAVACGDADPESTGSTPGDDPTRAGTIVATTSIWADITSNVACGAPVEAIIPTGADPHSYEPSLRDRELVSNAGLVIANGAGLEATTEELLDAAIDDGVDVVEVATHVDVLDSDPDASPQDEHGDDEHGDDEHGDDEHGDDEHGHGDGDPHVWQDPTRVAGALDVIASALAAAGHDTCEVAYRDELMALDTEIAEILAPIPVDERLLVTSHDSLAYFADRYDFEVVGTVIASTSTMAESSAGDLAELARLVEERSVRAIFTDAFESASDAEALADRIGIPVVPLVTGALTDDAPTYADMMRSNAATIAGALAP